MRIFALPVCVLIFLGTGLAIGQDMAVLESIYRGDFQEARLMIDNMDESQPYQKTLFALFLTRWENVPVAYSPKAEEYIKGLRKLRDDLEGLPNVSESIYYRISTYLLIAEYESSLGNQWSALTAARSAYPLVLLCFDDDIDADADENKFIRGLYLYYVDRARKDHLMGKLIVPFIKEGDRRSGLELLSQAAFSPTFAGIEAAIFLGHILLRFEAREEEALLVCEKLAGRFPVNIPLKELYAACLIACGQYEKAMPVVGALIASGNPFYECRGWLLKGILEEEFFNDRQTAGRCYRQCIRLSEAFPAMLEGQRQEAASRLTPR